MLARDLVPRSRIGSRYDDKLPGVALLILFLLRCFFVLHLRHLLCETGRVLFVLDTIDSKRAEHVIRVAP